MANRVWRLGQAGLVLAVGLAGCAGTTDPAGPGAARTLPGSAVSFDGQYRGTVHITGVSSGADRSWCDAGTQFSVQVVDNAFSYSQTHPNVAKLGVTTYPVKVAPDGTFQGESDLTGLMTGRIEGATMSGSIDGIACAYGFTATRL